MGLVRGKQTCQQCFGCVSWSGSHFLCLSKSPLSSSSHLVWSGIPRLSHQLGLMVLSWLSLVPPGCSIKSRQSLSPVNHTFRELLSPRAGVSEIAGKGFPAFPPIFFFPLHQCSLFTPYCIWQSQEERRREKRHKSEVCRGEKRGVIVNVCCPWLVAQQFCGMWDSLLLVLPCRSVTVSGGCCRKGCAWAGDDFWQQTLHRAGWPGCVPPSSSTDSVNN